jgi:glycosyltransferase involved in cell wall biosynthesis
LLYEAVELADAVRKNGVAHVHSPAIGRPAAVALVAARLAGAAYSVEVSGPAMHRAAARQGVADLVREATFVVTSSRFDQRFVERLVEGARPPPVHVIYDGIDLDSVSSRQHHRSGVTKTYRILALGPLVERSGFRDLLRACALMRERGLDFACDVIGAPDARADTVAWVELRKLHRELDLGSFVHFWGAQPAEAVARAYARADVVVLPGVVARDGSLDSLPRPLLEAMAAGLAVVASRVGAVDEIVTDGVDGALVPPGDPRALASVLERLAGDATLRERLGAAARSKAEARFGVARSEALALTFRRLMS